MHCISPEKLRPGDSWKPLMLRVSMSFSSRKTDCHSPAAERDVHRAPKVIEFSLSSGMLSAISLACWERRSKLNHPLLPWRACSRQTQTHSTQNGAMTWKDGKQRWCFAIQIRFIQPASAVRGMCACDCRLNPIRPLKRAPCGPSTGVCFIDHVKSPFRSFLKKSSDIPLSSTNSHSKNIQKHSKTNSAGALLVCKITSPYAV